MAVIFDTSQVPPGQREQVVRGALAASAAAMNVHFQCSPDEISYRLQHWQFGKAEMLRCGGFGGLHLGRTARMVREDVHDVITVGFQLQGSGFHAQNGFTRHESPGDLSVLDFTLPWQTGLSQSAVAGTVIFQAEDLGLPVDMVRRAAPLLPSSPVYGLLQDHLARLSQDADGITDPRHAAMVGKATTELARALVASAGQDELGANDTWHETLDTRLTTYLEHHLTDPDLCAEELARVHHISVRQLYKLWSRGESPSQWIIHERLEGASRDLSAPSNKRMTIAAVAHRWGFADTTHFSRRFREAYSMSPREWRQTHRIAS
jgi:AraC-like DNA-binding protein